MRCPIFISFINQLKYVLFLRAKEVLCVTEIQIEPYIYTYECKCEYFRSKLMFGCKSWLNFPQELNISEF